MTTPGPIRPHGRSSRPDADKTDSLEMSEAEKLAAQQEARHDIAARGRRGDPLGVQHYLAHVRSDETRRHADRPHPATPPTSWDGEPAHGSTGGVAASRPERGQREGRHRALLRWFRYSRRRE